MAFWLHLAAAPLIAHPIFHMLGVFDGEVTGPVAAVVIALYLVFAFCGTGGRPPRAARLQS